VHRIGIASVKSGRDIRRADQLEKLRIVSRAFAQVRVQIDTQFHFWCSAKGAMSRPAWGIAPGF